MYKIFFIAIIFCLPVRSFSQEVEIESIIQTAGLDGKLLSNKNTTSFISRQNYNLPWIRETEIRLGINGNATSNKLDGYLRNEDYYAIKISPNSLRERRYQRALRPALADKYGSMDEVIKQKAVFERYQSIATLYFAGLNLAERSKLQPLLERKHELLNQMLEQGLEIKFKDVVDVEYDKNDLQSSLFEYSGIIHEETERIRSYLSSSDSISINFDNFIQVSDIELATVAVDTLDIGNIPEIYFNVQNAKYSMAEYNFQKSRNRQIFGYFQAGYSPVVVTEEAKTKFNPANDLTFRIGLQVPIGANNNLRKSEAAIRLFEDQNDAVRSREKISDEIMLQKTKVLQLAKSKRQWEIMYKESLIPKLLKNDAIKSQITPLEILDMEILIIKLKLEGLKLDDKITMEYIELMSLTGDLNNLERNYLSGK